MLSGSASTGYLELTAGEAIIAELDRIEIRVGAAPLSCLVTYSGDVQPNLMMQCIVRAHSDGAQSVGGDRSDSARFIQSKAAPSDSRKERST